MSEVDINFFHEQHMLPNEHIIVTAECKISGNPFQGSLILTNKRLVFVRKEQPGAAFQSLRLKTVAAVEYRIENSIDFVMTIIKPKFEEEFQILAMDNARQTEFLKLVQLQVERRKLLDQDMENESGAATIQGHQKVNNASQSV